MFGWGKKKSVIDDSRKTVKGHLNVNGKMTTIDYFCREWKAHPEKIAQCYSQIVEAVKD